VFADREKNQRGSRGSYRTRVGELLRLQWRDVREVENVLLLPARKTKTGEARDVPIAARLGAILDMRRLDPAGHPFGPDDYVFGNELGERVNSFKKAWQTLVLEAHGYTPHWKKGRMDRTRHRIKGPLSQHQSALPRSPSRVRKSTARSTGHFGS
jgi:integrase